MNGAPPWLAFVAVAIAVVVPLVGVVLAWVLARVANRLDRIEGTLLDVVRLQERVSGLAGQVERIERACAARHPPGPLTPPNPRRA